MPLAILRRSAIVAAMLALTALPASAAEKQPFEAEAFRKAQASGAAILVDIAAPWCPTCQKQKPIIEKIAQDPRFKALKIFQVDFDTQKDVVRQLNARSQSTLIAFSGSTETARSVGDTNPQSIETLIGSSLRK
jgi:thioredoxin 1